MSHVRRQRVLRLEVREREQEVARATLVLVNDVEVDWRRGAEVEEQLVSRCDPSAGKEPLTSLRRLPAEGRLHLVGQAAPPRTPDPHREEQGEAHRQRGGRESDSSPPRTWSRHGRLALLQHAERGGQIALHLARAGVTLLRVRGQRALDDPDEGIGQVRTHVPQQGHATGRVGLVQLPQRPARDRVRPGNKVIEEHSKTVNIGTRSGGLSPQDLGGHVQRGSRDRPVLGAGPGTQIQPGSQVHQDDPPPGLPHHVLRLHIAVDESCPVQGGQGTAKLLTDSRRFAGAHGPLLVEQLGQRAAVDDLHPDSDPPLLPLGSIDHDHVPLADAGEARPFRDRLAFGGALVNVPRPQELQGDLAVQARITRQEDLAELPLADLVDDLQAAPARDRLRGRDRSRDRLAFPPNCGHQIRYRICGPPQIGGLLALLRPAELSDFRDRPQLADRPALFAGPLGLLVFPVHSRAVGDRRRQSHEPRVVILHGSSPVPGGPERG